VVGKSESFAADGARSHYSGGDKTGPGQDKLSQLQFHPGEIELRQEMFRHLMSKGLDQFPPPAGKELLKVLRDRDVIDRSFEFIVQTVE
jgi:hypothetical protein